jgi:branched-subunit amino acid permease
MLSSLFGGSSTGFCIEWPVLTMASKLLMAYGALMWLSCGLTYFLSLNDTRTLRDIGVWVKPMKFMAATALFVWTTVWVSHLANPSVTNGAAFSWICALIISTSFFEVSYITYQASQGAASHYNTSDPLHALLFGVMAFAAVGLTASQVWLAWEIWRESKFTGLSVTSLGVVIGLTLTFLLSTVSGFLLGAHQPPAGQGLPLVGWHFYKDVRPSHFLGVHAQQIIPLWGLFADRFMGSYSTQGLCMGSVLYVMAWAILTWASLSA